MKSRKRLPCLALLLFFCAAGAADNPPADEPPHDPVAALVAGNNQFACQLFQSIAVGETGNLVFSPYNVGAALAMAHAGAAGDTAAQLAAALRLNQSPDELARASALLAQQLRPTGASNETRLTVAARLWAADGVELRPEFAALLSEQFQAEMGRLHLADDPRLAAEAVNQWAHTATAGRIGQLVDPQTISADTRLLLTTAIHFKSRWTMPFDPRATHDGDFYLAPDCHRKVPMMRQTGFFRFAQTKEELVVELPFAGARTMLLLMPWRASLDAWIKELTPNQFAQIDQWRSAQRAEQIDLWMPRFRVTSHCALRSQLEAIGVTLPFSTEADFSGIAAEPLFISDVLHQTWIDVNEFGAEAAAATAIHYAVGAGVEREPPIVAINRPFVFIIRDDATGQILFFGKVTDPSPSPPRENRPSAEQGTG